MVLRKRVKREGVVRKTDVVALGRKYQ